MPFDSNGNAVIIRQVAVPGQTILAPQVNVPFDDVQSMLSQLVLRSGVAPFSGNQSMAGFKITNAANGSADGDYVTMAQLTEVIASVTAGKVPTGARMGFFSLVAPSGWVVGDGRTIGNPASNATNRANTDTYNLYSLFWSSFPTLPIYTSGGVVTTRGASFDADWNANKALQLFDLRSEHDRGADAGRGILPSSSPGSTLSDEIKSHTHGVTDPGHSHDGVPQQTGDNDRGGLSSLFSIDLTGTTASATTGITIQNTGGTETRGRSVVTLHCIKL